MAIDYLRSLRFSLVHGEEMKNRYFYRSRISGAKFREIVRHFAMEINASKTSLLCGVKEKLFLNSRDPSIFTMVYKGFT